jgi:predicted ATPase
VITRIEATNYRCFERLDVDLAEFGVLVGANGAGKTTLLDIPVLLGDLLKARNISSAFLESAEPRGPRASTLGELVYQGRGDRFAFAAETRLPETVVHALLASASESVRQEEELWPRFIRYELRLRVAGQRALQVQSEYLFTFSEKHKPSRATSSSRVPSEMTPHHSWTFVIHREAGEEFELREEVREAGKSRRAPAKTAAVPAERLALDRVGFEEPEKYPAATWLLALLTEGAVFFEPDWNQLRTASPPGLPSQLTADGRNLPWLALRLKAEAPEQFQAWVEHVGIALPQVTAIDAVEREEDHHAYFRVTFNDSYEVTSSGLSDGTLRILALTLLSYLDSPPRLLVVEEPENGIHPRAIEVVLEGLSSMYDSQVLVSSHSPVVVANAQLKNLLAARLERDGSVTIIPGAEHPRLVDWKGGIDLGSLFAAGVLG